MSSFRRRNVRKPFEGTRTSSHTGQVITSSGNPSMDILLGGGLPIGSICLIEEDTYGTHARVLAKYFLVEGVLSKHPIFLGSLDDNPLKLMRALPRPLTEEGSKLREESLQAENSLRIAWRYGDLPFINSEQTEVKIGHHYNLGNPIHLSRLQGLTISLWDGLLELPKIEKVRDRVLGPNDDSDAISNLFNWVADRVTFGDRCKTLNNELLESEGQLRTQPTSSDLTACVDDGVTNLNADLNPNSNANASDENADGMHNSNDNSNNNNNADNHALESQDNGNEKNSSEDLHIRSPCTPTNKSESSSSTPEPTTPTQDGADARPRSEMFRNCYMGSLVNSLRNFLMRDPKYGPMKPHRVCITSFGSPIWYSDKYAEDLLKCLTLIRSLVRNASSVCFITMPIHLIRQYDAALVPKIRNLVDVSIELDAFEGSGREIHPVLRGYSGLLHLRKVTAINTLMAYMPETTDLAFKLRRKKFVIEKLHLPPELQEDDDDNHRPTLGCGTATNTKASLDF